VSIIDKNRITGALDPETTDRNTGWFDTPHGMVFIDMPIISHIHGNFWVGGVEPYVILPSHFKYVVSLYAGDSYTVGHELSDHVFFEMKDSTGQDLSDVDDIARIAWGFGLLGDTLIHCQAGMNRSALVMSRVLQMHGLTPQESIDTIREKRSDVCLNNPAFERWTIEHPYDGGGEEA
jgi:protein-tyrosine phosphatase